MDVHYHKDCRVSYSPISTYFHKHHTHELFLKRSLRTQLDLLHPTVETVRVVCLSQATQKAQHDLQAINLMQLYYQIMMPIKYLGVNPILINQQKFYQFII